MDDTQTQTEIAPTYIVVREGGAWDLHCRSHKQGAVITPGAHGWPAARIKWFLKEGWIALNDGSVTITPKAPAHKVKSKVKSGRKKGK